jgi:uncharacterized protein
VRCPLCPDSVLVVSHRHGIEVDHCPTCRGVWLDRGELDHLVESVADRLGPRPAAEPLPPPLATDRPEHRPDDPGRRGDPGRRKRKKRKHAVLDLLEEVLDL